MTDTKQMVDAVPGDVVLGAEQVASAIDACLRCVQSCTTCVAADLAEPDVAEMRACIAQCLDCADVCDATARLLSRPAHSDLAIVHPLLQACVAACTSSAEECARHSAHHVHCAICEKVCRACVQACTTLLGAEAFRAGGA